MAEPDEHGVDCSNLDAVTAASVADFGRFDVVEPIRLQESKRGEPVDQLTTRLGPCKALK